jgi:hypothetical protein
MEEQDAIGLFYDIDKNVFIDEDGFVISGILELITPNDIFLFKHLKEYMVVNHRTLPGVVCELYYPEDDDPPWDWEIY